MTSENARRATAPEIIKQALEQFVAGQRLEDIAIRCKVTVGAVSCWAKRANLPPRVQGRTSKDRPDALDMEIVRSVRTVVDGAPTLTEIGDKHGVTRAAVHRIWKRWKDWTPDVPFAAGDKVRLKDVTEAGVVYTDYEVVEPKEFTGRVRDVVTGTETVVSWKVGNSRVVKL